MLSKILSGQSWHMVAKQWYLSKAKYLADIRIVRMLDVRIIAEKEKREEEKDKEEDEEEDRGGGGWGGEDQFTYTYNWSLKCFVDRKPWWKRKLMMVVIVSNYKFYKLRSSRDFAANPVDKNNK